jgi:hypothetical protein
VLDFIEMLTPRLNRRRYTTLCRPRGAVTIAAGIAKWKKLVTSAGLAIE